MTYKKKNDKRMFAYPTHILIADDDPENEQVMYVWNTGEIVFLEGKMPKRGKSYRLIANEDCAQEKIAR